MATAVSDRANVDEPDLGPARRRGLSRAWSRRLVLGAIFVTNTLLMYRPDPRDIGDHIYGNVGDPTLTTWILTWDAHALVTDPIHLFSAPMFWPYHFTLAYSENLLSLVPFFTVFRVATGNPVLAMNLLVLSLSVFCQVFTYLLARRLTGRTDAAVLAAVAYSFSSFVFFHIGHVQLLTLGTFPLCFLLLLRLLEERTMRLAVGLGVASACLFSAALYFGAIYLVCVAAIVGAYLVMKRFRPGPGLLRPLVVFGLVAGVLIAPIAYPYRQVQDELGQRALHGSWTLRPEGLVSPGPNTILYDDLALEAAKRGDAWERSFFQGFTTFGLTVVGSTVLVLALLRRRRRPTQPSPQLAPEETRDRDAPRHDELLLLCVGALASVALAVGPHVNGVNAPYYYFYEYVPGFSGIRAQARLAAPAMLCVAVLAGLGLVTLTRALRRPVAMGVAVVAVSVVLLELAISPVPTELLDRSPDTMAVYKALSHEPDGVVVELPVIDVSTSGGERWADVEGPRLLYSATDWHPRFNGYTGDFPPDYIANLQVLNKFPAAPSLDLARGLHIRYVVVHIGLSHGQMQLTEDEAQAIVDGRPAGTRAERHGNAWLIDLGAP